MGDSSNDNDNGEGGKMSHQDFPNLSHNAFNSSSDKNPRSFGKVEASTNSPDNMYVAIRKGSGANLSKSGGESEMITEAILEEMGRTMKSSGWSDDENEDDWGDGDFGTTNDDHQPQKERQTKAKKGKNAKSKK